MPRQKYLQYYELMLRNNEKILADFKVLHDNYSEDKQMYSARFHKEGRDILDIMRSYERKLCSGMERSKNSAYSDQLANKFWDRIRKDYPLIDEVGLVVRQVDVNKIK